MLECLHRLPTMVDYSCPWHCPQGAHNVQQDHLLLEYRCYCTPIIASLDPSREICRFLCCDVWVGFCEGSGHLLHRRPSRLGPFKQSPIIQISSSFICFVCCRPASEGCRRWVPNHCFKYPYEIDACLKKSCYAVYIRLISVIMHV